MAKRNIRPIAICVIRREGRVLVFEGHDSVKGDHFYRPLGGTIEFGEPSEAAVRRELMEEIGAELANLHLLGTLENIFTLNGAPTHEIVFVYEAGLADPSAYDGGPIHGSEDDGSPIEAVWKPVEDFRERGARLVPDGLLPMLQPDRTA